LGEGKEKFEGAGGPLGEMGGMGDGLSRLWCLERESKIGNWGTKRDNRVKEDLCATQSLARSNRTGGERRREEGKRCVC